MNSKKLIVFDFDGVLVNTLDMALGISQRNHDGLSRDEYLRHHEGNVLKAFDALKSKFDFFSQYQEGLRHQEITPEISQLITQLAEVYQLAIVSSTPSRIIRDYLTGYGFERLFSDILGGDIHHDKAEKLQSLMQKYALQTSDLLFITDTLGDVREANKVRVATIAVTWGYHPAETLAKGELAALVSTPAELLAAIRELS